MTTSDPTLKSRNADKPLLVRFRSRETATGGVTRDQLRELAESMGITETAVVHISISRMYLAHFGEVRRSVVSQGRIIEELAEVDLRPGPQKRGVTTIASMMAASIRIVKTPPADSKPGGKISDEDESPSISHDD